jgi:8-oxo-dGTP pyrophosphatase MutT (NUDIX family)
MFFMAEFFLSRQLKNHLPADEHERAMTRRLHHFLQSAHNQNPFARDLAGAPPEIGHVTGSAWIVNREYSQTVLLFHKKLGKWVQPGGHCDGEADVLNVAMREAAEETGVQSTPSLSGNIFDIDVHEIPEYWNTPAHLHFDVRFLLIADDTQIPVCSDESKEVRWVSLEDALQLSGEESVARMVRKTLQLAGDAKNRLR